jgi:hypothetical protein
MLHVTYTSTHYLGNAMQRRFSISVLSSVYNARCEPNLPALSNMKLPAAETDYSIGDFQKLVELTPCGHRSEKNSISTGVKIKFEAMQTIEETLFANRKTKEKNAPSPSN